jgi:ABC-type nitrate/sulfonate/bicarbonate transport system substrate-binding protein
MNAISRRRFTAAAVAPAVLAAAGRASAQAPRDFTLGTTPPTASDWPLFTAQELGFYSRYRLNPNVVFVGSVASIAQQLLAGSIDIGQLSASQVVEAVQNSAQVHCFLEGVNRPPYAFVAQKQYKRYADLKGKMVIIGGPADITVVFTERMFASGGLKMSDVDFTYAGATTDRYAALKSGSVAAAILFPPLAYRAIDEGYSLLGWLPDALPEFPFSTWTVTDTYGRGHTDLVVDFTKAQLRAVRWLRDPANRTRALDILIKRTNVSAEDAGKTYDLLLGKNPAFSSNGAFAPRTFALVVDALAKLKLLNPPLPSPTAFYNNTFADRANAELGREPKA